MQKRSLNERQAARLARLLRAYRADRKLSLLQLSELSGVNQATIVKLEQAALQAPHVYTIRSLGQALGIDAYELFTTAEWLTPGQLPSIGTYLRSKYQDLTEADIAELQQHLEQMHPRGGPLGTEDEQ